MSSLRCAYLVSRYPAVTHTFVLHEVRALRAQGAEIRTVTVRRARRAEVLSPLAEAEDRRTHALLPTTPRGVARAHLSALGRSPFAYLSTLVRAVRMSAGGLRNGLWQLFYFAEAMLLREWLEEHGLRHVHVHFANVSSDVALLCAHFGNRADGDGPRWTWSLTVHGPTELLDMRAHKLADKVMAADVVVCTSDYVRSQLMGVIPQPAWDRLHTLRSGIDLEVFHPPEGRVEREPVRILTVAGMSRRKGYEVLLDALAELASRSIAFEAVLVGDGPERTTLESYARVLGLGARVRFVGAVGEDAVPEHYREADIFCLPSYAEGVPTVLMEAMASELPVVATHVMGVPELVEHGRSGVLVAPGRSDLLADALERLAGDPGLRRELGREARERVAVHHDHMRSAEALARLLGGIVEPSPVAPRGGAVVQ